MTSIFIVWQVNSQLYSLKSCAFEENSVFLQKRKEPAAAQKKNMFCRSKMWEAKLHETPACITADALDSILCYFILFFLLSFFSFSNTQLSARNKCGSQEHFKTHNEIGRGKRPMHRNMLPQKRLRTHC